MNAEPAYWFLVAKDLHKVALLIAERIEADWQVVETITETRFSDDVVPYFSLGGVFWLNAGYALENLLKGLAIRKDPTLVEERGLSKKLTGHKLLKLAALAEVPITGTEGYFLWVAEKCVIWAGRYPITKQGKTEPRVFSLADISMYRHLYSRFCSEYGDFALPRRRYERL